MANEKLITLNNLQEFKSKYDNALEDGQIIPSKSLSTKSVDNISEESGTTQETPFINQGTGTNNNTDETPTSPVGKQLEKQGNTVCVNQLVEDGNFVNSSGYWSNGFHATGLTISNGVAQFTAIGNYAQISSKTSLNIVSGHKYLCSVDAKASRVMNVGCGTTQTSYSYTEVGTTNYTKCIDIKTANSSGTNVSAYVVASNPQVGDIVYSKNAFVVDLTKWFNGDIPQDLLDNPSHWSWYQNYGDYIPHNTGTLVNSDGQYLECGQSRNVWDEQVVVGALQSDGTVNSTATTRLTTSFIQVIPNRQYYLYSTDNAWILGRYAYYDKNKNLIEYNGDGFPYNTTLITIPNNARYLRVTFYSAYGSTYKNDTTISLYYATGENYTQYYPYIASKTYDTGTETLRSVVDLRDIKAPDGLITRRVGIVDLGTLTYTRVQIGSYYYFRSQYNLTNTINYKLGTKKLLSTIYSRVDYGWEITDNNFPNMCIGGSQGNDYFYVRNDTYSTADAFKTAMSGVYMLFELSSETTEQGTPFSENIEINDYGTMAWLDSNNALVEIPQGCKIFYPADYVLLMDDLNNYTDGDVSKLALKNELLAKKDTNRLTQTFTITGDNSENWETSGSYPNVKRFNLIGTFPRYFDTEHPRGIGTATSTGLTIAWTQESTFAGISALTACFYGGTSATVPQFILLIPNSEGVSTVEQLRTWLSSHNITVEYEYSKYKLVATLLDGVVTYAWEKD